MILPIEVSELAEMVAEPVGYPGQIVFDSTKPDGTPRKRLDVRRLIEAGWKPRISLREGIQQTYAWFLQHIASGRAL